jgi:hypothetical protein
MFLYLLPHQSEKHSALALGLLPVDPGERVVHQSLVVLVAECFIVLEVVVLAVVLVGLEKGRTQFLQMLHSELPDLC